MAFGACPAGQPRWGTVAGWYPSNCTLRIHLPASLGSTGIAPLQRYYGRSDSCAVGSLARGLIAARFAAQVSPIHAHRLRAIPSPTTRYPLASLIRYPKRAARQPVLGRSVFAHSIAGSTRYLAESRSSSYGLALHLLLLPTPPRDDAVTLGYGAGERMPRRGLAPL